MSGKDYAITHEAGMIEWYLEQVEEASFEMQSGEELVIVAKAEWLQGAMTKIILTAFST